MKKLTGLIIILAALLLGSYYGMGILTERTMKKDILVDQGNGLSAEITKYNRGLLTSEAQVQWKFRVPERLIKDAQGVDQTIPAQDYQVNMPLTVYHGPVIFAHNTIRFGLGYAHSTVLFPQQYEQKFNELFTKESNKPQLDLNIFINYLNQSHVETEVPAFKLFFQGKEGYFNSLGLKATTKLTSGLKDISGDVILEGAEFAQDDKKAVLAKTTTIYNLHETPAGLYLGDASFHLPSASLSIKDQKVFELVDASTHTESNIQDHLFNLHVNISFSSLLLNGQQHGPAVMDVSLKNIDADVLARINQQAASTKNGTEIQRQQAMIALLPELPKLFSQGAEFEISKLSLKIPEGQIEGNLFISLPKEENSNPFDLMQKMKGNAKLKVPAVLVRKSMQQSILQQMLREPDLQQALVAQLQNQGGPASALTQEQIAAMQADKQLGSLQQNGLIVVQGTDYLAEVTLEHGKFTVNGKPFDASMLKF